MFSPSSRYAFVFLLSFAVPRSLLFASVVVVFSTVNISHFDRFDRWNEMFVLMWTIQNHWFMLIAANFFSSRSDVFVNVKKPYTRACVRDETFAVNFQFCFSDEVNKTTTKNISPIRWNWFFYLSETGNLEVKEIKRESAYGIGSEQSEQWTRRKTRKERQELQ